MIYSYLFYCLLLLYASYCVLPSCASTVCSHYMLPPYTSYRVLLLCAPTIYSYYVLIVVSRILLLTRGLTLYVFKKEEEKRRRRSKELASPFVTGIKTDPSYLALIIYKSTVVFIRCLFLPSAIIKYRIYIYSFAFYGPVFSKGRTNTLENSVWGPFSMHLLRRWDSSSQDLT